MSVPTRRILDPIFGKPVLRCANNGRVGWSDNPTYLQKGSGWAANLYGGTQTSNDDWAACFIPVYEMRVEDFKSAQWTYYMTNAESMGVNMVIWVHDPDDLENRAEITQLGNISGLAKAQYWNHHELDITTDQFFFYGENTTGTGLTTAPPNYYGWDDFQADALFGKWTIYRISFEYGWDASGTFDDAWLAEVMLNENRILLKPSTGDQLSYQAWDYKHVAADAQVSAYPCVLHSIVVNGLTTAGDCTVYDNPAETGTVIAVLHLDATTSVSVQPITLLYDVECLTGLYLGYDGTLAADLTVSYK